MPHNCYPRSPIYISTHAPHHPSRSQSRYSSVYSTLKATMARSTWTVNKGWVSLSFLASMLCCSAVYAQLTPSFYNKTCPQALPIVKAAIKQALAQEARMGASLLRLHFHDCFVNGCDESILLDDTTTFTGEKSAGANANSVRGFGVIDNIKTQIEKVCSGIVSCSDILAIATRESVVQLGGPTWALMLGRRDSKTASLSGANSNLPGPTSSLTSLISAFRVQGLSAKDMVALSGAHTIGQSRCQLFRSRIYNESNIDKAFAASLQKNCPFSSGDNNLAPLDSSTANAFDNNYYLNLRSRKGLFHSDQELFNGGSADAHCENIQHQSTILFHRFCRCNGEDGKHQTSYWNARRDSKELRKNQLMFNASHIICVCTCTVALN